MISKTPINFLLLAPRTRRATTYIVSFDQSTYIVNENSGQVMVTIVLDHPPLANITVMVFTTDGSAAGEMHAQSSNNFDF